ncbi:MAG: cytochrome b N-terminal domain-containing protein, partial [Planctomycetaceae bacterium]
MINALSDWLDHRTGYKNLVHEALNEPIPGGARWWYVWGSTLSFVFLVQVITGFFLWSAYSPSTLTAWESVYYIEHVMDYGWLVRGIHHFAAQAMVVLLAMHFIQIVWDGAYKAPREVNFWLGLILMQIVLGLALTGYLLPWDQKGYYATQVATKIASVTPLIGPQIQAWVQGGPSYGHHTLTRFFALHAGVLPALLVLFLGLHIYVFRRHGITTPDAKAAPGTFWPDQVLKDAVACLVVLAVILFFVVWKGAELSAPADPAEEYPARPEWYFLFLFRFLKFEEIAQYGEAMGAIYIPGLIMAVIALMPFIARIKGGHWFNVLFMLSLILGAGTLTVVAMREDQADAEFQGKLKFAERDAHRVVELAEREGIPPLGARELMTDDSYTQGPRLFARHCAGCHRYDGHDGMEVPKLKEVLVEGKKQKVVEPATAADLGDFGSREWLQKVLVDYHGVFAPLGSELAVASYGEKGPGFLAGDMANWSNDNKVALEDPANVDSLKA